MFQGKRRGGLWNAWDLFSNGKVEATRSCVAAIAAAWCQCREINRGTLKGILEQAGVSVEEFMAAL